MKTQSLPIKLGDTGIFGSWFSWEFFQVDREGDGRLELICCDGMIWACSCLTSIWGWLLENETMASSVKSQQPCRSIILKVAGGVNETSPRFVTTALLIVRFVSFGIDDVECREMSVRDTPLSDK